MNASDTNSHEIDYYYSDMGMYEFAATAKLIKAERQKNAASASQAKPTEKRSAQVPLKRLYTQSKKPLLTLLALVEKGRTKREI